MIIKNIVLIKIYCSQLFKKENRTDLKSHILGATLGPPGRPQRYEEFYSGTVRYGIFAKSRYTGIFRYGISLIFSSRDFWKLFGIFRYFFIGAISDQL